MNLTTTRSQGNNFHIPSLGGGALDGGGKGCDFLQEEYVLIFCQAFILRVVDEADKESCPLEWVRIVAMMHDCEIEIRDILLDTA